MSTDSGSGALVVAGGAGVGGNLHVGSNTYIKGDVIIREHLQLGGERLAAFARGFPLLLAAALRHDDYFSASCPICNLFSIYRRLRGAPTPRYSLIYELANEL